MRQVKGQETMSLGVVLRRQPSTHAWQDHSWRVSAVLPGAPAGSEWRRLREHAGAAEYLAAALPLELYPGETAGYLQNLSQRQPAIYVVLRPPSVESGAPAECPVQPFHVTVCPIEAQDYLDGDDAVEVVAMPDVVAAWVADFTRRHHVERPFRKRKRRDGPRRSAEESAAAEDEPSA